MAAETTAQKSSMNEMVDGAIARVTQFEATLEAQQAEYEKLAAAGVQKDAEISAKDSQIEELKAHLMRLDSKLAEELKKEEAQELRK